MLVGGCSLGGGWTGVPGGGAGLVLPGVLVGGWAGVLGGGSDLVFPGVPGGGTGWVLVCTLGGG